MNISVPSPFDTIRFVHMAFGNYDFELALALMGKKKYADVWSYALPHAQAGDSNAKCMIALLHEFGLGVQADMDEAERWLRDATLQSNPIAWNNLGSLFMSTGDKEQARRCYEKAVDLRFTPATLLARG
jgi:TPR repeat protein